MMSSNTFKQFWENEETADVLFFVGQYPSDVWRFAAQKLILCQSSSEFLKMISKNSENIIGEKDAISQRFAALEDKEEKTKIFIKDIQPETFEHLLCFLYTGSFQIETVDSAFAFYETSRKYEIRPALIKAVHYLASQVTYRNVLDMFNFMEEFLNEDESIPLHKTCADTIDGTIDKVIKTNAFLNLTPEALYEITCRTTLQLSSELALFDAIIQWSVSECKRRNLKLSYANRRLVLGDILFNIRIGTNLVDEERLQVYLENGFLRKEDEQRFKSSARKNKHFSVCRFEGSLLKMFFTSAQEHSLSFVSERNFILTSVAFLGKNRKFKKNIDVHFKIFKQNKILQSTQRTYFAYESKDIISVELPQPLLVEPDVKYVFYVKMSGGTYVTNAESCRSICNWMDGEGQFAIRWVNETLPGGGTSLSSINHGQLFELHFTLPLVRKVSKKKWKDMPWSETIRHYLTNKHLEIKTEWNMLFANTNEMII